MCSRDIPVLFVRKEECCGCGACYAICPREAISMVSDEEGFVYPKMDKEKCIGCYQCNRVCPFKCELQLGLEINNEPKD